MEKQVIYSPEWKTPKAVVAGGFVFLSGTTSKMPEGFYLADGDIAEQTRIIIERIKSDLEDAGSSLENIVKVVAYIDDIKNWAVFNQVYLEYFSQDPPARTTIQAGGFEQGACIEMDVIAVIL